MKPNRFGGIVVLDPEKLALDADFYADFFVDFSLQGGFERFARFDFSSWKFPKASQMDVIRSLRDEDRTIFPDNCGNDINSHGLIVCGLTVWTEVEQAIVASQEIHE